MALMKPVISSHYSNDDDRQWAFRRTSGLPLGYFGRRRWWVAGQDVIVFWAVLAAGVAALLWSH